MSKLTMFLATLAIGLAMALAIWHDANRLTRRYCIESHLEEDTCMMMLPSNLGLGQSMPYSYECDTRVCDVYRCERRSDRTAPWQEMPCR